MGEDRLTLNSRVRPVTLSYARLHLHYQIFLGLCFFSVYRLPECETDVLHIVRNSLEIVAKVRTNTKTHRQLQRQHILMMCSLPM